jgi:hypothetical protein
MADNTPQGDQINSAQQGKTGEGFVTPYVASPWDRAMSVMDNEPTTGLADSGMPWGGNAWQTTSLHASSGSTLTGAGPGTSATLGSWPVTGEVHGRKASEQAEKFLGEGLGRGTAPGCGGDS